LDPITLLLQDAVSGILEVHVKRKEGRIRHMRRGYSEKFPTKKVGFLKLSADCKEILRVLKEGGSCGYKELVEKTKIPKGTIDRRLWFLKSLSLIISVKRKWMLVDQTKTYKNLEEYRVHLKHSRELVKGILAIDEFLPQFLPQHEEFNTGDILAEQRKVRREPIMWPCALAHLKTGYPDIFNLFEKCQSLYYKIQDNLLASRRNAFSKAEEESDIQTAEVRRDFSAERTNDLDKKSEFTSVLTEDESFKLDKETAEARNELGDRLTEIIWKVVNGEPLKGRCNQCPEVHIG